MKKLILVHGWGGSGSGGWFDWLKQELENSNDSDEWMIKSPDMPETENPKIDAWVNKLEEVAEELGADEELFLIGHSIGCQTIIRYLEKLPENTKIGGAIFVAGWFNLKETAYEAEEEKNIAKPWIEEPIDIKKVRARCDKFVAIFSDDDFCVPLSDKEIFEKNLGAETIVLRGKGHFDEVFEFPELLEEVLKISGFTDIEVTSK